MVKVSRSDAFLSRACFHLFCVGHTPFWSTEEPIKQQDLRINAQHLFHCLIMSPKSANSDGTASPSTTKSTRSTSFSSVSSTTQRDPRESGTLALGVLQIIGVSEELKTLQNQHCAGDKSKKSSSSSNSR
ncbi:hypothetical protein BT69DRAFT_1276531 [Atractiella rhizophila]|nr:hypothetical protein BT69DRAFT_1283878 [Atractiella rhizophila]KAH8929260.1 hypothetical protein BT69DRAFT_1276531 [Atractiella rhizophila]